jgi:EAL domain-containing protein (putative c-di-GMP-specific phosphodiesterase class I)
MHYQPIVDLVTGRPCGLQALVRWERPGVGLVPPDEFLPTIERGGFSVEFGFEIISEVLAAWKRSLRAAFARAEGDGGYVSINVDAVQLADAGFEDFVLAALARSGIAPEEVVLELTERAAIDQQHAEMLGRLRRAGVRIAVDDFGSGFSSLAQSTRLPVDVLKLDRSFVTSMLASGNDARLFVDMARLASTLGMSLIAEGVETSEVAEVLVGSGIGTGQGFFYSPALAEVDVVRWIASAGGEDGSDLTRVVAAER